MYSTQYAPPNAVDGPWTATVIFATGTVRVTNVATVNESFFDWVITPAETSTITPGPCGYVIQVDNGAGGLRRTLEDGAIQVVADISDPNYPVNAQSILEQHLAEIDKCISDLLNQRTERVSFGGKQYELWDVTKLWEMRNSIYARVVGEQEAATGNTRHRKILPFFINI